jgi:hypothetical protein
VLAEGSWRRGKARSERPTVSRGRRRTAIVGNRAPAKIEGLLGAGKHKQGPGKLARVSGEAMAAWWRLPTRPVVHRRRGSGGEGDGSSGGLRLGNLECRRNEYQLLMVLSRREREIRQARKGITAATRWRPAGARGGHGAREAGQQGKARAAGKVGVTRGEGRQQEVDGGDGGRVAARGRALRQRQKGKQRSRGGSEEEERGEKVQGAHIEN